MPKPKPVYTAKQTDDLLQKIWDGEIDEYSIPVELYEKIAERLMKNVEGGFGEIDSEIGQTLMEGFEANVYEFSAAKCYQQLKELGELADAHTNVADFKEEGSGIFDLYNDTYQEAEDQTAYGQAQNADKWQSIESQKDVLPMLRYSAVVDDNTSEICEGLDGLTAPVDDPVWDSVSPLNHFNCRCLLEQWGDDVEESENKDDVLDSALGQMNGDFVGNAGKDGTIFNEDHPYFDVPEKDEKYKDDNFGMKLPK